MEVEQQVAGAARKEHVQQPHPGAEAGGAGAGPRDGGLRTDAEGFPVGERVAITTQEESVRGSGDPSGGRSEGGANSVTRIERAKDIGTTRTRRAPERAAAFDMMSAMAWL